MLVKKKNHKLFILKKIRLIVEKYYKAMFKIYNKQLNKLN